MCNSQDSFGAESVASLAHGGSHRGFTGETGRAIFPPRQPCPPGNSPELGVAHASRADGTIVEHGSYLPLGPAYTFSSALHRLTLTCKFSIPPGEGRLRPVISGGTNRPARASTMRGSC